MACNTETDSLAKTFGIAQSFMRPEIMHGTQKKGHLLRNHCVLDIQLPSHGVEPFLHTRPYPSLIPVAAADATLAASTRTCWIAPLAQVDKSHPGSVGLQHSPKPEGAGLALQHIGYVRLRMLERTRPSVQACRGAHSCTTKRIVHLRKIGLLLCAQSAAWKACASVQACRSAQVCT
eukprot:1159555-Pelagomonas_calceolata.AAC.10